MLRSVIRSAVPLCAPVAGRYASLRRSPPPSPQQVHKLGFGVGAKPLIRARLFRYPSWATLHATSIHLHTLPPANSPGKHQLNRNNLHFDCSTRRPAVCALFALSLCCSLNGAPALDWELGRRVTFFSL